MTTYVAILMYSLLYALCLPLVVLRLLLRSLKEPLHRDRFGERLGAVKSLPDTGSLIWVHAVSLGEVNAAEAMIRRLLLEYRQAVLITNSTLTGAQRARKLFAADIEAGRLLQQYIPYDLPRLLTRAMKLWKPQLLIIMETELWPNLIQCCHRRQVAVVLINGRLSEGSFRKYRYWLWFIQAVLKKINHIAAQYSEHAERFLELGVDASNLSVSGNIKFDIELEDSLIKASAELERQWRQTFPRHLIWVCASTHKGEDEYLLDTFRKVGEELPLLMVLVPRHPERFDDVERLCRSQGLTVQRISNRRPLEPQIQLVLGDTMGELPLLLGAADVVFMGGSLLPIGGHNLIEPALWGKPILCGPHTFNFQQVASSLDRCGGISLCADHSEVTQQLLKLGHSSQLRQQQGQRAREWALHNRGALDKTMKILAKFIQAD